MKIWRYISIAIGALAIFVLFGSQIQALETVRLKGKVVLLQLAPVDPRALMMGDFMALRYAEENFDLKSDFLPSKGKVVLRLDANTVGKVRRTDNWDNLGPNELLINYVRQSRGITFGAPRYYFQNGTAELYEAAKYGKFRVNSEGRAILVGLVDETFDEIVPPKGFKPKI